MKKFYVFTIILSICALASVSALAADPITIGAPVLLSGHGAFVGGAEKDTLEMMAEELNKQGGINGRPLKFIFYDEEAKPDVAVRVVKRLIQKDKVDAILGVSTSWTAMPVIPIIERFKIPTIMLGSAGAIVNPVRPWVFKTPVDDKIVADKLLSYMKSKGITKLAMLSTQDGFGDGGHKEVLAHAKKYGVSIVFDEKYTMEDTDITPTLNKIKKTDAQAVVNWSSRRAPVVMTMNYRQMGLKLPLYPLPRRPIQGLYQGDQGERRGRIHRRLQVLRGREPARFRSPEKGHSGLPGRLQGQVRQTGQPVRGLRL